MSLYRIVYYVGLAAVAVGVLVGIGVAWTEFGGPPPVPLADLMGAHFDEAQAKIEAGDYDGAIRQLEVSTELRLAEQGSGNRMLARALLARDGAGDAEKAIVALRSAINAEPDVADAHNDLGVAYAKSGNLDEAIASVRRALTLDPVHPGALTNLERMTANAEAQDGYETLDDAMSLGRWAVRTFYRGELDRLRTKFSANLDAQLSYDALDQMRVTIFRQLGAESSIVNEELEAYSGSELYRRRARFERHDGQVDVLVKVVGENEIDGLQFSPVR